MKLKNHWPWCLVILLLFGILWWQLGPRAYKLAYKGHKFEYLEPSGPSTNREARLRIWVGYEGRRPRWWGQKVQSRVQDLHEWSFSNGVNIKGGGGFATPGNYDPEKDCYQYDLEHGMTAYRLEGGQMVAVAQGQATQCRFIISFQDPQTEVERKIHQTVQLQEGQEVFIKD